MAFKLEYYNVFRRFCVFLIGAVFFVSGAFKLLDPLGTSLIVSEYFKFLHCNFLLPTANLFGSSLAVFESVLGVALMAGVWRKVAAFTVSFLLVLFTILTFFLWIFNAEMDCGCFGEAVHLTNFQSFAKNIILIGLLLIGYLPIKGYGRPKKHKYVAFGIGVALIAAFAVYSHLYIPLIDFTNFQPMARLEAGLDVPMETYKSIFVYEKDGEQAEFTLEDLPDSTWTFVDAQTILIEGTNEVVANLSFSDENGDYCDKLATQGHIIVISVYNPEALSEKKWSKIEALMSAAEQTGYIPLHLTTDPKILVTPSPRHPVPTSPCPPH